MGDCYKLKCDGATGDRVEMGRGGGGGDLYTALIHCIMFSLVSRGEVYVLTRPCQMCSFQKTNFLIVYIHILVVCLHMTFYL